MKNFDRVLKKFSEIAATATTIDNKENENVRASGIVVAAGQSSRMNLTDGKSKISLELYGKSVIERTLEVFSNCIFIENIIVVCRECDIEYIKNIADKRNFRKVIHIVKGGSTRQQSVMNAVNVLPKTTKFIAIHDGARCLVTNDDIEKVILKAYSTGAATAGCRIHDTIKRTDSNGIITETINRENVYSVQTPQVFLLDLYKCGLAVVQKQGIVGVTDDCMIAERAGFKVSIVETEQGRENIKITTIGDLHTAENILTNRNQNN